MLEHLNRLAKKRLFYPFILAIVIALCLSRIIYIFVNEKEGYHSDEPWSYGFANSLYYPYLYSDEADILLTNGYIQNYNEWLKGSLFYDYLIVNTGDEFEFDSVVFNKSGDMSPPFFEIILHAVCSFFPETFSWWYAFSINIILFVLVEILLYSVCLNAQGSKLLAVIVALFYGLSLGAISTFIYLRMYALLTMFTLLTVLLFQKVYSYKEIKWYLHVGLILAAMLGAYTHYYYLLFAFLFTFMFCFFLLIKKQVKKCMLTGISMLLGVIGFIAIYPYALKMIMGSGSMYDAGVEFPFSWLMTFCINLLLTNTIGIKWIVDKAFMLYVLFVLFFVILSLLALSFLLRNEVWFKEFKDKRRESVKKFFSEKDNNYKRYCEEWNPILVSLLITVVVSVFVVAKTSYVEAMGLATDRYMFNIFPVFIFVVFVYAYRLIDKTKKYKTAFAIAGILLLALLAFRQNREVKNITYLFNKGENKIELHDYLTDKDIIVASACPFRMEWYSVALRDSKNVLFINPRDLDAASDSLKNLLTGGEITFIVEVDDFMDEADIDVETGTYHYDVNNINGWNNTYTEKEFYEDLHDINPIFDTKELQFTQQSFCGELKIYKIQTN